MDRSLSSAGCDPGRQPGPMALSLTLAGSGVARLVVAGVLDRDGLAALVHLAHVGFLRGYRELVLDVHGLIDFPSALFAELRQLGELASRSHCRLRMDGLDAAVAAVAAAVWRDEDAHGGEASG